MAGMATARQPRATALGLTSPALKTFAMEYAASHRK
jgi:hypothetical protein